jgi:hypothetical protein
MVYGVAFGVNVPGSMSARKDNPPELDALYGLEPVIEPGDGAAGEDRSASLQSRRVRCPYCGERFETLVDLSAGPASYIEDCQVCCRPIEFRLEAGEGGPGTSLQVGRSD